MTAAVTEKRWYHRRIWQDYRYPASLGVLVVVLVLFIQAITVSASNKDLQHQLAQQGQQSTCRNEKAAALDVVLAELFSQLVIAVTTGPGEPYDTTKLRALAVTAGQAAQERRESVVTCLADPRGATVVTTGR